jgi:hypothetical protein
LPEGRFFADEESFIRSLFEAISILLEAAASTVFDPQL